MAENEREKVQRYRQRLSALELERSEWDDHWKQIVENITPRKGFFKTRGERPNRGERRDSKILDGTGTRALRVMAAGLQGGLTSPARPWFKLGLVDDDLAEWRGAREWLHYAEKDLYRVFHRSNFYTGCHSVYYELGAFGTGCMLAMEDLEWGTHYRPLTVGEYYLATDHRGRVNTVFRRVSMTAFQMLEKFGRENLSLPVRAALDDNRPYRWFDVIHVIQPRETRDHERLDNRNMPFESVYFEAAAESKVLAESGFMEFPAMAPRWEVTGSDVYGRSPGMDTLGDVKMLQRMQSDSVKAIGKMINPPMRAPKGWKGILQTKPGGMNYIDTNDRDALAPLYQTRFGIAEAEEKIRQTQDAIRQGFYNDLFMMIANDERSNVTATEIIRRYEEKQSQLGPVIENLFNEFHEPAVMRTLNMRMRQGALPPLPEELQGQELRIEFVSILALAQKMSGIQGLRAVGEFVGTLAGLNPQDLSLLDKFNREEAIDQYADMMGIPPKVIRSDDQVAEIRQARAKQEAEGRMIEEASAAVAAAKQLSETNTAERNALTDLVGA